MQDIYHNCNVSLRKPLPLFPAAAGALLHVSSAETKTGKRNPLYPEERIFAPAITDPSPHLICSDIAPHLFTSSLGGSLVLRQIGKPGYFIRKNATFRIFGFGKWTNFGKGDT